MFAVKPQSNISAISKTDRIIIPALSFDPEKAVKGYQLLIDWIKQQYEKGAEIASMCSGAFMLAATGLLDGRACSIHWVHANKFRAMFPNVNLQTDRLITDENGICTNGGAFSFLNLMIYLVEKYYDRQTAIDCSKLCRIEMGPEQPVCICPIHRPEIARGRDGEKSINLY